MGMTIIKKYQVDIAAFNKFQSFTAVYGGNYAVSFTGEIIFDDGIVKDIVINY